MGNKFNARGVSEDFKQCYDFLKMFSEVHGEYHGKLDDNKQETYDFCFDEVDQKTFTFRHSVYNYLKGNEEFIWEIEVLEKLIHHVQILILSLESLKS